MKKFIPLLLPVVAALISSCSPTVQLLYGYHQPKHLTDRQMIKYASRMQLTNGNLYSIDSTYLLFVYNDTLQNKSQKKNHFQPMQALYYPPHTQYPSVYYINCYAPGFPNLNWNKNNSFEKFPPAQQAPLDSLFTLADFVQHLRPLSKNNSAGNGDEWNVYIIWTHFMNRQGKRLIRYCHKNAVRNHANVRFNYILADNAYADTEYIQR